ncbi:MAG: PBP1A family penicillin-binding protein, partial [Deltaproteobacteria bacterium]|nr:PBP1A family penicillin-binding protein [Deltaproteobacteria bacterium]
VQGGSTITQQVTRSLLLTRQRTYVRKIREAILATRLERYLSKDQILYLYLNQIYFGNRAYGVKAAAENYFRKELKALNLAEMALLAAFPRAPENYSPFKHPKKAKARQRYVLDRLLQEGIIREEEMEEALKTELDLHQRGTDKESNRETAPYFTEYLRPILLEKYGEEKLYYGGLKIYTPIDPVLQKAAQNALRQGLEEVNRRYRRDVKIQGALYAQEIPTGFVKTMVGGYDFQTSEFNRAMSALRQPGSAFKPFVYAAALDKGYRLPSPIADTPFAIPVGDKVWAPKNYDGRYRGITTVHNALVHSYNVATARIGYHIRLPYLTAYIRKMGITTPINPFPSMSLGANGVHLYEMVASYAIFPSLGVYHPPVFILKVEDLKGNVLEEYKPPLVPEAGNGNNEEELNKILFETNQKWIKTDGLDLYPSELKVLYGGNIPPGRVMTPQTAYLMLKLMSDVVQMGTGHRVKALNRPVAGKTGTSNESTDVWFIGYTPQLAAGVWVGYDDNRPIGKGEQGGHTAAPIFLEFMKAAAEGTEPLEFAMPEEVKGKDLLALTGGSAKFAEYVPMEALGLIEGGTSQDRAADFLEMDMEGPPKTESPSEETQDELY